MDKKLFKGTFNWAGESYTLYTYSNSSEKAFLNFATQLSVILKSSKRAVIYYFDGKKDNYYLKEVKRDESKNCEKDSA